MADLHPTRPRSHPTADAPGIDRTLDDEHGDGRNIDRALADEHGEAATLIVREPDVAWPLAHEAEPTVDPAPPDTYYDLPVVKVAPWRWYIPTYFYVSGLAGA